MYIKTLNLWDNSTQRAIHWQCTGKETNDKFIQACRDNRRMR